MNTNKPAPESAAQAEDAIPTPRWSKEAEMMESWVQAGAAQAGQVAPVAYAVTAARGGIHKLSITRESAERKAAAWREEWPDNGCRVRPLVFADVATERAPAPADLPTNK